MRSNKSQFQGLTLTSRLVDVPIMQHKPPKVLAWAMGIKNLEGDQPRDRAQSLVIGMYKAT